MRSAGGTKSAPPWAVVRVTKSVTDFFTTPSFQDGRGSLWARAARQPIAKTRSAKLDVLHRARNDVCCILSSGRRSPMLTTTLDVVDLPLVLVPGRDYGSASILPLHSGQKL